MPDSVPQVPSARVLEMCFSLAKNSVEGAEYLKVRVYAIVDAQKNDNPELKKLVDDYVGKVKNYFSQKGYNCFDGTAPQPGVRNMHYQGAVEAAKALKDVEDVTLVISIDDESNILRGYASGAELTQKEIDNLDTVMQSAFVQRNYAITEGKVAVLGLSEDGSLEILKDKNEHPVLADPEVLRKDLANLDEDYEKQGIRLNVDIQAPQHQVTPDAGVSTRS